MDMNFLEKIDNLPKVHCPITHHFAPGVYLREMFIPKGTVAVGHFHKEQHFCTLVQGVALFIKEDKKPEMLTGPCTFLADPGHKIVYAATDIIVQNVHPNPDNITDQDKLEELFIAKTGYFDALIKPDPHLEDKEDFKKLEYIETDETDIIALPMGFKTVLSIRKSEIHGKGIFASYPFEEGAYIGPFKMLGKTTELGKYLNHSKDPNAEIKILSPEEIIVRAKRVINGTMGDSKGEEITIDYRELIPCLGEQSQERRSLLSAV